MVGLASRFPALPTGPWSRPPAEALVLPMAQQGQKRAAGIFVAGLNPFRQIDESVRSFVGLLVGQIASGLANVHAYEEERRRAQALAELDRAKTMFFSNVSHEFRTPLTLLLGPLDEARRAGEVLPAEVREQLDVAHRNSLRLLKLVNTLLDFTRIEAGRVRARFEPVDLATLTTDLASNFRSAMEKAGLEFEVACEPLSEPVYVDREMWEKIVLNLISNAFKFTLAGKVTVSVSRTDQRVLIAVADTGRRHFGARAAARLRALSPCGGKPGAQPRRIRHRPGARPGAGEAARWRADGAQSAGARQHLHRVDSPGVRASPTRTRGAAGLRRAVGGGRVVRRGSPPVVAR